MSIDETYFRHHIGNTAEKEMVCEENHIKDLREDLDLTQQKLAEQIGITQRKYSYIETGTQPLTVELLVRLANLYHVSIDSLPRHTNNPERNV